MLSCSCLTKVSLFELVRLHWRRYSSTQHSHSFLALFCTRNAVGDTLLGTRKGTSQYSCAVVQQCHCCRCDRCGCAVGASLAKKWSMRRNGGFLDVWSMCHLPAGKSFLLRRTGLKTGVYKDSEAKHCYLVVLLVLSIKNSMTTVS